MAPAKTRCRPDATPVPARESRGRARSCRQPSDDQAGVRAASIRRLVALLVGQINRKHYCFAVDGEGQVQGFMGWALASEGARQGLGRWQPSADVEDSRSGDHVVVNAFSANSTKVTRFLVDEARRAFKDKTALYFKRHYKDGTTRIARVAVQRIHRRPHRAQRRTSRRGGLTPTASLHRPVATHIRHPEVPAKAGLEGRRPGCASRGRHPSRRASLAPQDDEVEIRRLARAHRRRCDGHHKRSFVTASSSRG